MIFFTILPINESNGLISSLPGHRFPASCRELLPERGRFPLFSDKDCFSPFFL